MEENLFLNTSNRIGFTFKASSFGKFFHHGDTEDTENIFDLPGSLPAIATRSGEAGGYRQIKTNRSAERGRVFAVDIPQTHGDFHTLV
jgi:hypothetical protein